MFGLTEILYTVSHGAGLRYECARFDVRENYRHPLGRSADPKRSYLGRMAREAVLTAMSVQRATFNPREHSLNYRV